MVDTAPAQTFFNQPNTNRKGFFNSNLFILLCLILALGITLGVAWYTGAFGKVTTPFGKPQATTQIKQTPKQALYSKVTALFVGKSDDIVSLLQLASSQKDEKTAYTYYVRLYQQIAAYYKKTNNPEVKSVLNDVKTYTLTFDQYSEGDFK